MKFLQNFWVGFCLNGFKTSCIASHLHYNNIFMHYRCMPYLLQCCVVVGLDWAEPMMYLCLHVTCSCNFMHTYLQVSIFLYVLCYWCFFDSLFLPLFLFFALVASWHRNANLLRPRTLCVLGLLLLLLLILPLLLFGSVMRRPVRTSRRNFLDEAFIRNTKLSCQISLTLTYPLSSTVGVASHYVASWSHVLS